MRGIREIGCPHNRKDSSIVRRLVIHLDDATQRPVEGDEKLVALCYSMTSDVIFESQSEKSDASRVVAGALLPI